MTIIRLLNPTAQTGHPNPDRLLTILKDWHRSKPLGVLTLVQAMGFQSPAPLLCCLKALEQAGAIQISDDLIAA
jgi:hypothetical protein